ncbi:hypothetical protein GWK47_047213 [Chionoecetes opilio]|uniref:Uncharacterized protein n=1 Tax=Chionoecetes opilio TaxID=41210 RepID=A0A8J5CVL7_CHIOP|nr:hypothetical protein GWK47_047213 [Chionoecetes opilio]
MASLVARSVALNARRGVQVTSVRFANKKRFMKAVPVKGTQQYHRFVPVEPFGTLQVFKVSTEQMGRLVSCLKSDDKLEDDFVVEEGELVVDAYVGCVYEKQLWFAMIEELSDEFGDLLVSFLGPQGKSGSHAFPSKVDRLWLPGVMADPLEHATGLDKQELLAKAAGNDVRTC